jgi:hypothetical protein
MPESWHFIKNRDFIYALLEAGKFKAEWLISVKVILCHNMAEIKTKEYTQETD